MSTTPDRLDKLIALMRDYVTDPYHAVHTADYADLRIATAHLVEKAQAGYFGPLR